VSTQKSDKSSPSRAAKRAQFSNQAKKSGGASPLVLIAGLVVVVAIIGGVAFALTRPSPSDASASANPPASAVNSYGTGAETLLVRAATHGHDPYPQVTAENGVVRFPLSNFDDYNAHHFTYMNEGRPIEFFVLKSNDGVVRAAFNACDVCFGSKKGYTQDGDHMICNNCGRRFPADQINVVHGGCNPSPLTREVEGDTLIIQVEDLVTGQPYF
jgi:hypothetical protein